MKGCRLIADGVLRKMVSASDLWIETDPLPTSTTFLVGTTDRRRLRRLRLVSPPCGVGSDFLNYLIKCIGKLARAERRRPETFFAQSENRHPPTALFNAQRVEQRSW